MSARFVLIVHLFSPFKFFHRRPMLEGLASAGEGLLDIVAVEPAVTALTRIVPRQRSWSPNLTSITPISNSIARRLLGGGAANGISHQLTRNLIPKKKRLHLVFHPHQVKICEEYREEPFLYECYDNYPFESATGTVDPKVKEQEDSLLKKATVVLTTSRPLYRKCSAIHKRVLFTPNGTNVHVWRNAKPDPELFSLPRPIAGYVGYVGPVLDLRFIKSIMENATIRTVLMAGPADQKTLAELRKQGGERFRYLGCIPHEKVPSIVKSFDIGLIPYSRNAFADCREPLKLWDMLAAGVPVVGTDLPSLKPYHRLLSVGATSDTIQHVMSKETRTRLMSVDLQSRDWVRLGSRLLRRLEAMGVLPR